MRPTQQIPAQDLFTMERCQPGRCSWRAQKTSQPVVCSEAEREHAGDRERWQRKGAARQEAAVAAAAEAAGANTADVVARRALLENELMAAELAYQSRQARRPHPQCLTVKGSHVLSAVSASCSATLKRNINRKPLRVIPWVQAERLVARSASAEADAADLRRQLGLAREAGMEMSQRSSALVRTANGLARPCRIPGSMFWDLPSWACLCMLNRLKGSVGPSLRCAVLRTVRPACGSEMSA